MQTVIWSELLELGHDRIDAEHRVLLTLASEIERIIETGGDMAVLQPCYQDFHRRLAAHCAYEEGLLRSLPRSVFGAQVDTHCRGHASLIAQAANIADGAVPDGYDTLHGFTEAYFRLMHDLLIDDSELIGALIREGRHAPGSAAAQAANPWRHPPI